MRESPGARMCYCETKVEDPNPIVRINTGRSYDGMEPRPTQIPFIAAGLYFTRAEFLWIFRLIPSSLGVSWGGDCTVDEALDS